MADFRKERAYSLAKASGLSEEKVQSLIEIPPDSSLGDYAFPCFALAKEQKKNPSEIAKTISSRIKAGGIISKVETKGPYVNLFIAIDKLAEDALKAAYSDHDYGSLKL